MRGQTLAGGFHEGWLRIPAADLGRGGQLARCVEFSKGFAAPTRRRELPSRHITFMITFGDPLVVVGADDGLHRVGSFVTGLQSESTVTERFGHQYGIHLELTPLAAYALFGLPMRLLTNDLVDLAAVLGGDAARLVERLACARSWPDRLALLESAVATRMIRGPRPLPAVAWAWHQLRATNGSVRVQDLVEGSGLSHRYLVTRFYEQIGMAPKSAARVLRFEHSLSLLQRAGVSAAEAAATAGYFDQAHLNREFRALTGCSPLELLGSRSPADVHTRSRSDFSKTGRATPP